VALYSHSRCSGEEEIPVSRQDFSLQLYVQRVHPVSVIILTGGYFPRAKTAGE
jgi:hypothetical protein